MAEPNPIAILESLNAPKTLQGMRSMFRYSEEKFGGKKFELDIFEKYSTKIRNRNQFKANVIQEIGKMFTFSYRPLAYATLPYYDIQPLIFSLSIPDTKEIIGMNFHYLSPSHRIMAYESMTNLITDINRGDKTRLRLIYDIMKTRKRYIRNMVSIRKYKTNRIRSVVYEIDPKYWEIALTVPTQMFVKKNERNVYMDTNIQIRKLLGR